MSIRDQIESALRGRFAPDALEVEDVSESHRGHSGWREGGQTHFDVHIRAAEFGPMSRIARHRAVHAALGADLVARIHALSLDISA